MKVDKILEQKNRTQMIDLFNMRAPNAKAIVTILLDEEGIPRLVLDGIFSDIIMLERIFNLQINKEIMNELKGQEDEHE